jgi:imidazolonepropionase-like amidohydrolase
VGDRSSWRNYTRAEIDAVVDEAHALGMPVAAHAHSVDGIQEALEAGVDSIEHATLITRQQADAVATAGTTVAPTLLINEAIAEGRVPVTAEAMEKAAELVARRDEGFRYAATVGVRFVLGTDANGHHVDFGDQMAELIRMHQVFGYDAQRCLRVATSEAATVVGLGDRVGTVKPGYGADFLVVRGRPWLDVADLRVEGIVAVVSRGKVVAGSLPAA